MLGTLFYNRLTGIVSIQEMTYEFNREDVARNLYRFMRKREKEYLLHGVTVNEYLERLAPRHIHGTGSLMTDAWNGIITRERKRNV